MNPEERTLRESIRRLIKVVKNKKVIEENKSMASTFSRLIKLELQSMLMERGTPDVDPTPNKSTGINVLEELLKKIVPVLETDYKSLTTNPDQRQSFRAHIVNAVVNTLTPAMANNEAGDEASELQEIEIDIQDDPDPDDDKFIDIRTDAEKSADEEPEEDPRDTFGTGVEGDETGRNMAFQCFKKIETSVIDSYELLSNPEDQELFYDYLIANLKLYFDKFEGELSDQVTEPSNQAYSDAKADAEVADGQESGEAEFDLEI